MKPQKINNNTELTIEQIEALPLVGICRNVWRQRDVRLYRVAEGEVISIGVSFDRAQTIIAREKDAEDK